MTNTTQVTERTCPTCGATVYQQHCHDCEPAEWYEDLADWHARQAQWARGAADEERARAGQDG